MAETLYTGAWVVGDEELAKAFDAMEDAPAGRAMLKIMRNAAKHMQAEIKKRAPIGPPGRRYRGQPIKPGALKRAVQIRSKRRYWAHRSSPEYIVAMNGGIAPHAHLVEYGHAIVRRGTVFGEVPPHPYFRPGVFVSRRESLYLIESGMKMIIKEVWRRGRRAA